MKPAIVASIEKLLNFTLHPAPKRDEDLLSGLMAYKAGHPKYALDNEHLVGLNLANTGLDDATWQKILALKDFEPERLRALNLSDNKLTASPLTPQMKAMERLDVSGNQITEFTLPGGTDALTHLNLDENPLTSPPPDVVQQGMHEILKWLRAKNKRPVLEAKVMFIGDSSYGKTHLIEMLKHGKLTREILTTHGIERSRIEDAPSPAGPIRLNIWDLGGQRFMRSTHQFFFTERTLYVLVTVARRERKDLNHWLQLVHEIGADAPVLVVINKTDLDDHDIDREPLMREYPNIIGFVRTAVYDNKEKGIVALETIRNLKDEIRRVVANEELMPSVFVEQRPEWFTVKEGLEAMGKEYISYEEYRKLEHISSLPDEEKRLNLRQLASLGTVVSFVDDPRLADTHVINPKWIMDGVYCLINDHEVKDERRGRFSFADFERLLDPERYPPEKYRFLVELMEKFRLCYPLRHHKNTFLLPDLFSDIEPPDVWPDNADVMRFRLNYGSYPPDLFMTQFIVERYTDIEGEKRWRSGVVVGDGNSKAIVRRSFKNEFIEIEVAGPPKERRSYLRTLLDVFRELHRPFEKLEVAREVPYEEIWLNYDHLLKLEEKKKPWYHPDLEKDIPISEVLDGYGRPGEKGIENEILKVAKSIQREQKAHRKDTKNVINKLDNLTALTERLSESGKEQHETLMKEIAGMNDQFFQSEKEQKQFFEKIGDEIKKLEPKTQKELGNWQDGDIKHKIKVCLPLIIFRYEAEMDVSDFKFPRSWKDLKAWFLKTEK